MVDTVTYQMALLSPAYVTKVTLGSLVNVSIHFLWLVPSTITMLYVQNTAHHAKHISCFVYVHAHTCMHVTHAYEVILLSRLQTFKQSNQV